MVPSGLGGLHALFFDSEQKPLPTGPPPAPAVDSGSRKVGETNSPLNLPYVFSNESLLSQLLYHIYFNFGVDGGGRMRKGERRREGVPERKKYIRE